LNTETCRLCPNRPILCQRKVGSTDQAIVLDYPTALEARKGSLLEGDTGRLIKQTLKGLGVDARDIHVVTALNCKPETSKPKSLRESMECCRARLLRELRALGVKRVLCAGTISYAALTSTEKIPRMDKVHGRWMRVYGMEIIATYSPTRVLMDSELFRDFSRTFEKFFTTDGREPWPTIRLHRIRWPHEFSNWLADFAVDPISCDIETDGFNPIEDNLLAVGFGYIADDNSADVAILDQELLDQRETWELIGAQLTNGETDFHNGRFDLKFLVRELRKHRVQYEFGDIGDTMLLNYCLDERPMGRYGAHSLKNMSRIRYDAPDYDINMGAWIKEWQSKETTSRRRKQMLKDMHTYLSLDCYYTARLGRDLREEVREESPRLLKLYDQLYIPGTIALADIEYHGCKLDRSYLEELAKELTDKSEETLRQIREYVEDFEFNPASSKQMYKLLYVDFELPVTKTARRGKLREGPTSQPVLRILRSKYPKYKDIIDRIIEYRRLQKTLGTYIYGLLDRMDGDGRIRCNYLQHGTVTGRLSSQDPNLQNIPEKSHIGFDVRAAFIPSGDNWYMIEADYSQLELRVAAHCSQDQNFISAYVEDRDLHKDATDAIYQREDVTPYERWLAKCMVFGALYGRGAESLAFGPEMEYMENELGGTRWTLKQTEEFFKRFFNQYPELRDWQAHQREIVYKYQVIETPMGMIRRFPFIIRTENGAAGRQAMNTPIQSTASDITFSALIRIHKRLTVLNNSVGRIVAHIVLTVHDSITTECHPKFLKPVVRIIDSEMRRIPIESNVPFKAKIGTGPNWSECK
jgi:uracil-DNA glycosylase family 4